MPDQVLIPLIPWGSLGLLVASIYVSLSLWYDDSGKPFADVTLNEFFPLTWMGRFCLTNTTVRFIAALSLIVISSILAWPFVLGRIAQLAK